MPFKVPVAYYKRGPQPAFKESQERYYQDELRKIEQSGETVVDALKELESLNLGSASSLEAITEDVADLTTRTSTLETRVGSAEASITTEQTVRATADSALASSVTTLTATVNSNTAQIISEQTARVNGDNALAANITTLTATVNSNTAAITSEQTARANADSALASSITSLTATVNSNTAAITSEQTARANADSALSSSISSLTATVNGNTAAISNEATARANADSAISTSLSSVTARVGTAEANISSNSTAIASVNGQLSASYNLKAAVSAGGVTYFAGMGLGVDPSPGGAGYQSNIRFEADKIRLFNSGSDVSPFYVEGGNVYMTNAFIKNADIGTLKIAGNAVTVSGAIAGTSNQTFYLSAPYGGLLAVTVYAADWAESGSGNTVQVYVNGGLYASVLGSRYVASVTSGGESGVDTYNYSYSPETEVFLVSLGGGTHSISVTTPGRTYACVGLLTQR